jgi:pseudaminic acid cytidylyltransferase
MTICIIPARSGSKRVKNKNIKLFAGKPIISYAIQLAKSCGLFKRIVVSTDSYKILKIAKKYGAEVPFLRTKKLSNNFAPTSDVLIDCINKISSQNTKYHFCLYPCTTLIYKKDLINSFKKMKKNDFDQLITVSDYNVSPYRAFKFAGKNRIEWNFKKFAYMRTQNVPTLYHDTGSFYIFKTKSLLKYNRYMPKKTTYYFIDKSRAIDVNTESDFKFAEFMFKFKKQKKL